MRRTTFHKSARKTILECTEHSNKCLDTILFINEETHTSNKISSNTKIKLIGYHCDIGKTEYYWGKSEAVCVESIPIDEQRAQKYHFCCSAS